MKVMLILKTQTKTIICYLDKKSLVINEVRYLGHEIQNIKTNYPLKSSHITIRIQLKNGRLTYITDTHLFSKADQQQKQTLQQLLSAINKRLKIEPIYNA